MKTLTLGLAGLLAAAALGCGGTLTEAPPPLRPDPVDQTEVAPAKSDCQPVEPGTEDPIKTFQQRSISESERLARSGIAQLQAAEAVDTDTAARIQLMGEAVDQLITALLADPYNVNATYNLAAAYARIDRPQCAINMLERMLLMRKHPSRDEEVAAKIDRLLGSDQPLDPDFNDMRGDARFRRMIEKMCEGSSNPSCVRR